MNLAASSLQKTAAVAVAVTRRVPSVWSRAVALIALLLVSAACSGTTLKGSGTRSEIAQRTLTFEELEVDGPIQTSFVLNREAPRVHDLAISGDSNLIGKIDLRTRQDRLYISALNNESLTPRIGLFVEGRPRTLRHISLRNGASARISGQVAEQLIVKSQDTARFTIEGLINEEIFIEADDDVRGGLHGESQELTIIASKKARINAENLRVGVVHIRARDRAVVIVCATDFVDAVVTDRARVIYSCDPDEVRADESDRGRVSSRQEVDLERKERARRRRIKEQAEEEKLRKERAKREREKKAEEARRKAEEAAEAAEDDD